MSVTWRTSTYSNPSGNCVEVAHGLEGIVAVRDSKDPDGPVLSFTPDERRQFARDIQRAETSG